MVLYRAREIARRARTAVPRGSHACARRRRCIASLLFATAGLLLQHTKNALDADLFRSARIYGMHAAWEKRMDRAALSATTRLPGGPASSHALLDSYLGLDEKMAWEDVLSQPELRPRLPKASVHDHIDARIC